MKAVDYLKAKIRMCTESESCRNCLLGVFKDGMCGEESNTEEVVEIVEKWAKENPAKTYLSVLLEKLPNTKLYEDGYPNFCPYQVFNTSEKCTFNTNCEDCWNREYKEEENV